MLDQAIQAKKQPKEAVCARTAEVGGCVWRADRAHEVALREVKGSSQLFKCVGQNDRRLERIHVNSSTKLTRKLPL